MGAFDVAHIANEDYLEFMYKRYQEDPASVDEEWQAYLGSMDVTPVTAPSTGTQVEDTSGAQTDRGVMALVHAFRSLGHMVANLDPLGYKRPPNPLLEISEYGFSEADLDKVVGDGGFWGAVDGTLRDLLDKLKATYCRSLGVEYVEVPYKSQREWLQRQMEPHLNQPQWTPSQSKHILDQLIAAETFEQFLHTKYIGHKRFSIEGGESLIPLLTTLVESGAALDVGEIVMGMAHRGRLNVLAHMMNKPYDMILSEFEGVELDTSEGSGDVKYHMGFSHDYTTLEGKQVHLSLSPNPSHLELVNPVIEGIVFAKQAHIGDIQCHHVVPVVIHGDAAFTGQGIVPETICLSHLEEYDTGGTVHIIVNNQIGFTAEPRETRFTSYPSDVAKVVQVPVFHVNADDPEAVVHTARLAMAYRQAVKADVIIDLWCYRRYGHNEADDPMYTQPLRSQEIAKQPTVATKYARYLVEHNQITQEEVDQLRAARREKLDAALESGKQHRVQEVMPAFGGVWKGLGKAGVDRTAKTAVTKTRLEDIAEKATTVPEGFHIYRKLDRLMQVRVDMVQGKMPLDWGCAEMLAFGSLMMEGTPVRLVGQDAQRGTFSHRQAAWHDQETGEVYIPLANLSEDQGVFTLVNTMLSEFALLGFEYGVSSAEPRQLTLWEAQFGDFSNMAQPIVDQFISSSEAKWQRMCGLVMLLPHGFEGQGPEHSSARLERYLALCAEDNLQVGYMTTPAQYFHILRRQMLRTFRKPLILMQPKSLLRHKGSTSPIVDFYTGHFHPLLDDPAQPDPGGVKRLVFCSGKVFFDLNDGRVEREQDAVALIRIEELYPFPWDDVAAVLEKYAQADEICWVQEEPQNMGSWDFVEPKIRKTLGDAKPVRYIGRRATASTATGIQSTHLAEQKAIVDTVLDLSS